MTDGGEKKALWDFAWSSPNQPRMARIHAKKNKKSV